MACRVRVWGIRGDARGDTPCRVSERESESGDGRAAGGRGRGIQKAYWQCVCASFSAPPSPPSSPPLSHPILHTSIHPSIHPSTQSPIHTILHTSIHSRIRRVGTYCTDRCIWKGRSITTSCISRGDSTLCFLKVSPQTGSSYWARCVLLLSQTEIED